MDASIDIVRRIVPRTQSSFIVNAVVDPVLLLHMDGVDGSTNFPDATGRHNVVPAGNAQVDTAQFVFGTGSVIIDGAGTDALYLDGSDDFAFGTGDFTIDLRFRAAALTNPVSIIYDSRPTGVGGLYPQIYADPSGDVHYWINESNFLQALVGLTLNTWYHVAVTRASGVVRLFVDGKLWDAANDSSFSYLIGANRPVLGLNGMAPGFAHGLNGWTDEVRVIKGRAFWTSDFVPPTAAYTP